MRACMRLWMKELMRAPKLTDSLSKKNVIGQDDTTETRQDCDAVIQVQERLVCAALFFLRSIHIVSIRNAVVVSHGQVTWLCNFPAFPVSSCLHPAHQGVWLRFGDWPIEGFQRSFPSVQSIEAALVWPLASIRVLGDALSALDGQCLSPAAYPHVLRNGILLP